MSSIRGGGKRASASKVLTHTSYTSDTSQSELSQDLVSKKIENLGEKVGARKTSTFTRS